MTANITSSSLEIELKRSFFSKRKMLLIDALGITYNNKTILFNEVKRIRYGSQQIYINGIKSRRDYMFHIEATERMNIEFGSSSLMSSSVEKMDKQYSDIINVLWKNYTSGFVNDWIKKLNHGDAIKVGNFEVNQKGIKVFYTRFLFVKKEELIPWKECLKGTGPGYLYVQSSKDKKMEGRSMFLATWNLNAFHSLLNYLWENGNCFKLEKGEKI